MQYQNDIEAQRNKRAKAAFERSLASHPSKKKHKSPSKLRRLARRAEARALTAVPDTPKFEHMTMAGLKKAAQEAKIPGRSKMDRAELIRALYSHG